MRILGLDLSLTSTGYCLLDDDQVTWFGSVSPKSRDVDRLAEFDEWIRQQLISEHVGPGYAYWRNHRRPDHVAVEGYSYGSPQGHTHAFAIGELGGVVKLAVHAASLPLHIVPPSTWKKLLLGKGNLAKDQVRLQAFKRFGVEFASQDTLDAWAVAMTLRWQLTGLDRHVKISARKSQHPVPAQEAARDEAGTPAPHRPVTPATA